MKTFEIVHDLLTGDAYTVTFRPVKPNSAEYAQIVLTYEEEEDPVATFSASVAASSDDATEKPNGTVSRTGNTGVGSTSGNSHAGLRFTNVTVSNAAAIADAKLTLVVNTSSIDTPKLYIYGEATDSAAEFTLSSYNISGRSLTTAKVLWNVPSPGTGSGTVETPDIAAIIQEIVNRPGWTSGNNIAIIMVDDGGDIRFNSYDTGTAPKLDVTYTTASSANPKVGRIRITTKVGGVLIN